jgi:hypothetical protein
VCGGGCAGEKKRLTIFLASILFFVGVEKSFDQPHPKLLGKTIHTFSNSKIIGLFLSENLTLAFSSFAKQP